MKVNQWTMGLAAAGVISFGAVAQAEEKPSNQVLTAVSSTALSGYVSTSAHWNPGQAGGFATTAPAVAGGTGVPTGPRFLNGKGDGFNVDVVDITVSKPLDEGEWSAGYAAELWLGPDAGRLGNGLSAAAGNAIALKQAYLALNVPVGNGITVKMGAFDAITGYESLNAGDNPNYTRSYGNTLQPDTHTGVLASYKFCDILSASVGIANTYDGSLAGRAAGVQSQKTYLAGISLTAPDSWGFLKGAVLNAGVVDGISLAGAGTVVPANAGAGPDVTLIYVGATIPTPWETLKAGVAWDHLHADRTAGVTTSDADAVAAYVTFSGIEKLKLSGRVEFFDNGSGLVQLGGYTTVTPPVGTPLGIGPASRGAAAVAGAGAAELLATTITLDYQLWANVISRLEYRWDHDLSAGGHLPGNVSSGGAGVTGAEGNNNAHMIALNLIYKF